MSGRFFAHAATQATESICALVVGLGPGGMLATRMLEEKGFAVDLIEKRETLEDSTQAGIALPGNALQAAEALGLRKHIEAQAHRVHHIDYADLNTGHIITSASLDTPPLNAAPFVALPRATLLEILFKGLKTHPRLGTFPTALIHNVHGSSRTRVQFNYTKECKDYDLVIAADGVHSSLREICASKYSPIDLGFTSWRCIVPFKTSRLNPTYFFSPKKAFMAYPCGPDAVYVYAHLKDGRPSNDATLFPAEALQSHFWESPSSLIQTILKHVSDATPVHTGRISTLSKPIFRHKGVIFMGDAASASTPMLQQGVASAFEDVLALRRALNRGLSSHALDEYADLRRERTQWIIDQSTEPYKKLPTLERTEAWNQFVASLKETGPLNVAGWRHLMDGDYLKELLFSDTAESSSRPSAR